MTDSHTTPNTTTGARPALHDDQQHYSIGGVKTVPQNEPLCPGNTIGVNDDSVPGAGDVQGTGDVQGAGHVPGAGEATATSTGTHHVEDTHEHGGKPPGKVAGLGEKAVGTVKSGVGSVLGSQSMKTEGELQKSEGQIRVDTAKKQ